MKISDLTRTAIKPDGTRIPVVDGKFSFLVQPTKEDIKNGVRGDHANCMYSVACRRLYASELVWITRRIAYVELKNKKGEPELRRFILKDPARNQVKGFDQGKDYATPEAVIFARPEGNQTLDAIRVKDQKFRMRCKAGLVRKKAYVKGQRGKETMEPFFRVLRAPACGMFQFRQNSL
jgi:hypothetical protein